MSANTDTDDSDEPSLADLGNADAAAEAGSEHIDDRNLTQEAQEDLTTTRQNLETPHAEDGGETPHEGRESHVSGDQTRTDAEPFEMTHDRRIGTVQLHTGEDETTGFGKPSAMAGREMMDALEGKSIELDVDDPDEATQEELEAAAQGDDWLLDWLALTLAEWSLNDDYGYSHWLNNHAMSDLMQLVQGLRQGGNLQGL